MRRLPAIMAVVAALALVVLAVTACGISRVDAARDATAACKSHGGVATGAQNQFYYHDASENSAWNATCADGTVVAGE